MNLSARKQAELLGPSVTGTLGVLVKAKGQRLIGNLRPHMDSLTASGFRLADPTRNLPDP
jgi:predicted nucleic acid-binding protein